MTSSNVIAQQRPGGARTTSGRRRMPELRRRSPTRPSSPCTAAARCSPASATIRSSSTWARRSTPSTIRNGTGNAGGGKDDLAGYNIHSIVLQVPEEPGHQGRQGRLRARRPPTPWSACGPRPTASGCRPRGPRSPRPARASRRHKGRKGRKAQNDDPSKGNKHDFIQVSRLGNPLINEVVIPLGLKDQFNATQPADDAKNFGKFVLNPELAHADQRPLPGPQRHRRPNRTDIVQALLTGLPGKTQIAPNPAAADTLKLNLGVPPAQNPSRFGVLGGDLAGFPDGRRLGDDVVDIEERVVGGALKGNNAAARRRRGPERQAVPVDVPVPRPRRTLGPRLAARSATSPTHDPVPAPSRRAVGGGGE